MRTWMFSTLLLVCGYKVTAQQFEDRFRMTLPDSVVNAELTWADLDNDGLLDLLLLAANTSGKKFFLTYKTDTLQGLQWKSTIVTPFTSAALVLTDLDRDNFIDAILSGNSMGTPRTTAWLGQGNFSFVPQDLINTSAETLRVADLSQDGYSELILGGSTTAQPVTIYSHVSGRWTVMHDSIKINATSLEVFDFDKDGDSDLFISGRRLDNNLLVSAVYDNERGLRFTPSEIFPAIEGHTSLADLDHDGNFDIVLAGKDTSAQNHSLALLNHGNSFQVKDTLMRLEQIKVVAADFNANGKCDLHYYGYTSSGDTINVIVEDNGVPRYVVNSGLKEQLFGDFNRDGNLDLLQYRATTSGSELVVLENKSTDNKSPAPPANPIGLKIYNRFFLYWEKPQDDHTPTDAITYDVALQISNEQWIASEFDLLTTNRLTVSHGNQGNTNYLLLRTSASTISYFLQAVDNSFHAGDNGLGGSGICTGVAEICSLLEMETIEVCRNEEVRLIAGANALWFSFADGFLGESSQWLYDPEDSDTIFSVSPSLGRGCNSVKVYSIKVSDRLVKKTQDTKHVCEGAQVDFKIEDGWSSVEWSSLSQGFISNASTITYTVLQNDSVKVLLSDNDGCFLQRSTALIISKPAVSINGEIFQILRGGQVQLIAAGGAGYQWTPPTGLTADNVADPIASPTQTTQYTVTVTDSLGCSVSASVLVLVEGTAFVPNLFTPNDDGRNDYLRIYGLTPVNDFLFTIHNREGSLVYETRDIREASSMGWNGAVRGTNQPGGVYYWKVKGVHPSGRHLLLNGKRSGSIVLIR